MKTVIDTHAHIFPEPVAQRASDNIGNYYSLRLSGNGTLASLRSGALSCETRWVISSAALNPAKTAYVNDFIHNMCIKDSSLIGLGSVHVDTPDRENEVERLISLGLRGIKLHPDFQHFDIDDPRMYPVYEQISGRLPLLLHVGDPTTDYSHPRRVRKILDDFPKLTVVAAHMGGYNVPACAEEYLVGTRAYFDTSNALRYMSAEALTDMIRRHGIERVMFGSDFPLMLTNEAYAGISALRLTDEEWDLLLYQNAVRVFQP